MFLFSVVIVSLTLVAGATGQVTELTIENPYGSTITGSTVYWTFEIIEPNKVASPGETVDFRMRITNLPESDVPLELFAGWVTFDAGFPYPFASWNFDLEWVIIEIGETYEGPFGHFTWTNAAPIGYLQEGVMGVSVHHGVPGDKSVPYTVTIRPIPAEIDIKPGSFPNSINPKQRGVIPVAVLTTDTFDACTVDPATVALEGVFTEEKGKSGKYGSLEDVDGDGDLDLVVQIPNTIEWDPDATEATLTGLNWDGVPIEGTDSVRIVPPK